MRQFLSCIGPAACTGKFTRIGLGHIVYQKHRNYDCEGKLFLRGRDWGKCGNGRRPASQSLAAHNQRRQEMTFLASDSL
jgi:hypothetical protein